MKTLRYSFTICLLILSRSLLAQTFYNGSLEPVVAASVSSCMDNNYWGINTIGNVFMTTVGPQKMYVADNTCGLGFAKDGAHYIGLHYSPKLFRGNQLLLELNADMIAGKSYVFSFYYKGPSPLVGTGANLEYGYAVNDTTVDTTAAVFVIAPVDTVWRKVTATVTPAVNCRFIWVAALSPAGASNDSATTYVDYFVFNPPSNVPIVNKGTGLHIYPEPLKTTATLELDDNIVLPCSMVLYDISGHIVLQQSINDRKVLLNKAGLNNGMYFLQLTDRNAVRYTTKLLAD
ncbi:MAG: T9SS type A sorting domain-containing protein [Bacteroidetes bacterium]|nr:T9SS type A sorting domain-containing protein [Bacteroidota bacterium]